MATPTGRPRRFSDEDRQLVVAAYEASDGSLTAAAAAVGSSEGWAYSVVRAAGKVARPLVLVRPAGMRREAVELYERPLSCREVVAELARRYPEVEPPSHEWVRERVKDAGKMRGPSASQRLRMKAQTGKDYDEIRRLGVALVVERRWSPAAAARHLEVSKQVIVAALPKKHRLSKKKARRRRAWEAQHPDVEARLDRRAEVVYRRRELHQTYPEIEEATGLSRATVNFYLRGAGLTRPSQRTLAAEV